MQRATFLAGSSAYRSQTFSNWRSTDHSPTPRVSKTAAQSTPELARSRSRYSAISLQSAEVAVPKSDSISIAYEFRTKSAKSGGLETNGRRERISGLSRGVAVRRFSREGPWLLGFCARSKASGECWAWTDWRSERDSNSRYGTPVRLRPPRLHRRLPIGVRIRQGGLSWFVSRVQRFRSAALMLLQVAFWGGQSGSWDGATAQEDYPLSTRHRWRTERQW